MDLEQRRREWRVLQGLCRGLTDCLLWEPLWVEAATLRPNNFTHDDLGKVFRILKEIHEVCHREQIGIPEDFLGVLRKELEAVNLGAFSVECLLNSSSTDLCLPELREEIRSLLRAKRGVQ